MAPKRWRKVQFKDVQDGEVFKQSSTRWFNVSTFIMDTGIDDTTTFGPCDSCKSDKTWVAWNTGDQASEPFKVHFCQDQEVMVLR